MTVMDAKEMGGLDKTRAAVNGLTRIAMFEAAPMPMTNLPGATRRVGVVLGTAGLGKTNAQVHRALALYTLWQHEPTGKTRVVDAAAAPAVRPRRKASPKAVALLERFKDVPSVDPHHFREDVDRVLGPGL